MKKLELLKIMVVVGLSLIMVLSITNLVFAADEDDFDWDNAIVTNNSVDSNAIMNNIDMNNIDMNNIDINNLNSINNLSNINSSSLGTSTSNYNTSNTTTTTNANKLANTGVSNFNGTIALVIVLGVIVAIYSYKKVNEYKNV